MDKYEAFYEMVKKWTVSDYRTQKIKAEVIVDMLISDYIEEIMSQSLGKDIKLIAKEFPIARIGQASIENESVASSNRQYASVDFLMSGNESGKPTLYLVELKTSDDSMDGVQLWNMLWTCEQGSESLYNRFYDIIINYGVNDNGNDLSTKKYQYTLSKYAVNYNLRECGGRLQAFGDERPGGADYRIKEEQAKVASAILSNLKTLFVSADLKIVYIGLNNKTDFTDIAKKALQKRSIKEKITKDNTVIRLGGTSKEIQENLFSFIAGKNIKQLMLTNFIPSEEKTNEWKLIRDILVELQQEPWGDKWFDEKKLRGDNT